MKFLVCGLGSIGQRHYKNLKTLGYDDVIVYRTGLGANAEFIQKFLDEFSPKIFSDLHEALKEKPDVALVTNPTSLHIPTALEAARAGCHLFIEKPLSDKLDSRMSFLKDIVKEKRLLTYVAYHFRFHPLLKQAKEWLDRGLIGAPVSANAVIADRVTDWHPWEDHRQSYACRRDLGGGVILTQSHALDWLYWFFGPHRWLSVAGGQLSGIDVEDTAKMIIEFESGVIASVHLDYIQFPTKRELEIVGTDGKIVWAEDRVWVTKQMKYGKYIGAPDSFERNTMYIEELKYFIDCLKNNVEPFNNIWDAEEVLKMAVGARNLLRRISG